MLEMTVLPELLKLAELNMGFDLGKALINLDAEMLENFEEQWIESTRRSGGLSRSELEVALNPKRDNEGSNSSNETTTDKETSVRKLTQKEQRRLEDAEDLADDWRILQAQIFAPKLELEMADEWYFTLTVKTIQITYRLPYHAVAMGVCNRLIQHYTV